MRRALAAAGLLLTAACGGGDVDRVGGEPAPTEEAVCFNGSYEPAEEGTTVPREEACPEDSASPSPAPASAPGWDPTAAFLSPEAAAQAEQPGWQVSQGYEPEAGPLLDPCGEGVFPRADDIAASDERAIASEREAGGSLLEQEVFRYRAAADAEQAFADYAEALSRCPELADPAADGHYVEHTVVSRDVADGVQRLLVRRQPCMGRDICTDYFGSHYVVAQVGDGLTAAHYALLEDGDGSEVAPAILSAVAEQLAEAVTAS